MDGTQLVHALLFSLQLALPVLLGALLAAIVIGILQVATQISDSTISAIGRLSGVALALYLFGTRMSNELVAYAAQLWSSAEYFRW